MDCGGGVYQEYLEGNIQVMRVFALEDDPDRIRQLCEWLAGTDWVCIQSCIREDEFEPPYDLILLDYDLGGRQMGKAWGRSQEVAEAEDSGLTFVRLVKDKINPEAEIVIHSYNPEGAKAMQAALKPLESRRVPFGPAIKRLIEQFRKVH